jgi:DNA-binding NtrC family response regulator
MPGMDGLELQARLAEKTPDLTVIMMTAYASVETAVGALKAGAYDYIVKPFDPDELTHLVERASEHRALRAENVMLKQRLAATSDSAPIIGTSPATRRVLQLVDTVAPADTTVLVLGESGTGKELVAQALHARSPRRFNPLVAVHCGALAEGVLESELFGHEKGAFTGARYPHKGIFEQAEGGTIFLDEIGDIGPRVQVDLPPPTATSKRWCTRASSATTSIGGSTWCRSTFRRCAIAARTSRSWPTTSCSTSGVR